MSVTVDNRDGALGYTWSTAAFAWSSTTGQKPWTRMYNNMLTLEALENAFLGEADGRFFSRQFAEAFGLRSDLCGREILKAAVEAVLAAQTLGKRARRDVEETLGAGDALKKAAERAFAASLSVEEAAARDLQKRVTEQLALDETFRRFVSFARVLLDSVWITDALGKQMEKQRTGAFALADGCQKASGKNVAVSIGVAEEEERRALFQRAFAESVQAAEYAAKRCGKPLHEIVEIAEAYLRNANATLSDLYLSEQDLTYEAFQKISMPLGFEPFRDFVIGDYEYKEALFRLLLKGPVTEGRPLITNWTLNVDVPDISDRGTCIVPKTGLRVDFNKSFYSPPELSVIVRAGANAMPEYTADDTGFDVKLYGSDGQPVQATISWSANGY